MRNGGPSARKRSKSVRSASATCTCKPLRGARIAFEGLRQIAVDFDHVQMLRAQQKIPGQCAAAGTDFHDAFAGSRATPRR